MYITRDELIDRFGQREIERLENNINDPQAVQTAITDAVDVVNGYLSAAEALPLPMIPASVKRVAAVMVRYYLYKDKPTEQVRTDYEDAIRWLEQVSSGKIKLILGIGQDKPIKGFVSGAIVV
ncbi:gp436 family protein [Psychrobacter celer]|uniref:gp436 family protein n=1 Tax=Psychrobacter celer TaxID=306572 RepID=UPI003FD04DD0